MLLCPGLLVIALFVALSVSRFPRQPGPSPVPRCAVQTLVVCAGLFFFAAFEMWNKYLMHCLVSASCQWGWSTPVGSCGQGSCGCGDGGGLEVSMQGGRGNGGLRAQEASEENVLRSPTARVIPQAKSVTLRLDELNIARLGKRNVQ